MAPNQRERINALEAVTTTLQQELAAHCAATIEKFTTLDERVKRVKADIAATNTKIDANQAVLIVLLTPLCQGMPLPLVSPMPATILSLSTPADPASVELPPSPTPASGCDASAGKVPPPIVPPDTGGLLFTNLVMPRDEEKGETDIVYRTCLAKEARSFLRGRTPGEGDQEYQHCATLCVALGSVFCEHTATANADTSPIGQRCPIKPGIDLPAVDLEDPEDPPPSPDFRSRSVPLRATPRALSRFRDNSEVWEHWWEHC
jgi:hypothetical protein